MGILNTFIQPATSPSPVVSKRPVSSGYGQVGQGIVDSGKGTGLAGTGAPDGSGQGLENTFYGAIEDERRRRQQLADQEDTAGAGVDTAITGLEGLGSTHVDATSPTNTEGFNSDATRGFSPDATSGVDLSAVQNFQPTEQKGVNFDSLSGVDLSNLSGFKNTNLDGTDVSSGLDSLAAGAQGSKSALSGFSASGFDAGAALKTYADGATSDFFKQQKISLDALRGSSVGAGRLDTGFFDKDQGDVIEELGRGYTSDIAKQAVAAAQITASSHDAADATNERALEGQDSNKTAEGNLALGALNDSATLRFNKADASDKNLLTAATNADTIGVTKGTNLGDLDLRKAQGIDSSVEGAAKDAASLGLTKGATIDSLNLDKSKTIDANTLNKDEYVDTSAADKAKYQDTFKQTNLSTALTARQARTNQLSSDANQSSNRYLDALTGGINLNNEEKDANAKKTSSFWSGLLDAAGTIGGFALGGPTGAAIGGKAGTAIGGAIS